MLAGGAPIATPAAPSRESRRRPPRRPRARRPVRPGQGRAPSPSAAPADRRRRRAALPQRRPRAGEDKRPYSFGAMDVEGKLKTPQLLYFLNRVKLELDMSAPDKRSFMKELQQSADDKNL